MEFRDVVSNVRGNHGLKFGGEFRRELNDDNLNGASRPLYTFAGLFNFANDAPLFYQINADPETGGVGKRTAPFPLEQLWSLLPGRLESAAEPDAESGSSLRVLRRAERTGRSGREFCVWTRRWSGWLES